MDTTVWAILQMGGSIKR